MLMRGVGGAYIYGGSLGGGRERESRDRDARPRADMVKRFSVDWLAQSCHAPDATQAPSAASRPHVPCVVQPRPPTSYDRGYLQPKPRTARAEAAEVGPFFRPASCSSPVSEVSGYSSGYESEAACSECPSVEDVGEGEKPGAHRRVRTKFTPEQIQRLEKIFSKHKYLDAGERVKTAVKLNLSENQVRTWFQNRRMKLKREVQDVRAEFLAPALLFPPVPGLQHHAYRGQRHPYQQLPPGALFYPAYY
ncbi:ventral homeobox [Denticeps clupeoides]|uniref:ventral homeobox n=1 Tax=Denticeps clupeoides TaxID=299321 RepID=UPI0010A3DDC2|nr:homeobox protein vent1-like [Denticeps clupeoides]